MIDVDVVGSIEFDWRGSLTPEGFLDGSDQLGVEIYGLCRTEAELAKAIGEHYSRILRNPEVVVRILDRSNRPTALVTGAVQNPARFQIRRPVRLNELIVLAGGLTDMLGGEIRVFRPPNLSCVGRPSSAGAAVPVSASSNQPVSIDIRITDLLAGIRDANPYILSGDVVTVNEAAPIYVIGGVNSPQAIPSRGDLTVSRAVATAGGVARNGIESAVTVYRRSGGTTKVIEMDLRAIDAESAEDMTLLPFDIVEVGMRGNEKRLFPPVIMYDRMGMGDGKLFPLRIVD
ncbi:MAG: SLBB domain-containing protein [Blastocatellia bacterium]|nr:SLBB domain-containing protein [Blastocatellia bacterium]